MCVRFNIIDSIQILVSALKKRQLGSNKWLGAQLSGAQLSGDRGPTVRGPICLEPFTISSFFGGVLGEKYRQIYPVEHPDHESGSATLYIFVSSSFGKDFDSLKKHA